MSNSRFLSQDKRLTDNFDICIIGSGASGSFVAETLVQAGWNVIMIEQGQRIAPGTHLNDLLPRFERAYARDQDGRWTTRGYPWSACALGGGTKFYAGVSFRYRHVDFDASPFVASDTLDTRWPINYDDLKDFYNEVEQRLGVSRSSGLDPAEPEDVPPAPLPPHALSRRGELIARGAKQLTLHPFPTPLAIHSLPYQGFPACQNLTSCTDYSCPIQAKADVASRLLNPLLRKPNFTLCTQFKAVQLHQRSPHCIESLECIDLVRGKRVYIRANIFMLSANAIQSAALVLRSTNRWWPLGVGNMGLVGHGLCFKLSEYVFGWARACKVSLDDDLREKNLQGLYSTVSITDYYLDSESPSGLGGLIYEANPWDPIPDRPEVLLRLECILADQPVIRNCVRLSNIQDELGLPRLLLDYRTHPLDEARLRHMIKRGKEILRAAKATDIGQELSHYSLGSTHMHGTCRAGTDADTSVVDKQGKFHTLENLYVSDGSFMPFPGGVNPTLTIQANALRIARSIANQRK